MGILPSILSNMKSSETIVQTSADISYGKTTFKFDFEKGDFVTDVLGNVISTSDPKEVLSQVIDKILHDARYRYLAYPNDYGNEIQLILEQDEPFEVIKHELKRLYEEALIYHPLIESVSNFAATLEGDEIVCEFDVAGTNGAELHRKEASGKWTAI